MNKTHFLISKSALPDSNLHYSGHIKIKNSFIFFWYSESSKENDLLLWLNGGPGCSSMDGLFLEVGSLRITKEGLKKIKTVDKNIVFIDYPVGKSLTKNRHWIFLFRK